MLDLVSTEESGEGTGGGKGLKAQKKYGSLAGYVIANDGFEKDEIEMLRAWFGTPEMVKELDGVEPSGGGKGIHDKNA
jgi:hypothetical protein